MSTKVLPPAAATPAAVSPVDASVATAAAAAPPPTGEPPSPAKSTSDKGDGGAGASSVIDSEPFGFSAGAGAGLVSFASPERAKGQRSDEDLLSNTEVKAVWEQFKPEYWQTYLPKDRKGKPREANEKNMRTAVEAVLQRHLDEAEVKRVNVGQALHRYGKSFPKEPLLPREIAEYARVGPSYKIGDGAIRARQVKPPSAGGGSSSSSTGTSLMPPPAPRPSRNAGSVASSSSAKQPAGPKKTDGKEAKDAPGPTYAMSNDFDDSEDRVSDSEDDAENIIEDTAAYYDSPPDLGDQLDQRAAAAAPRRLSTSSSTASQARQASRRQQTLSARSRTAAPARDDRSATFRQQGSGGAGAGRGAGGRGQRDRQRHGPDPPPRRLDPRGPDPDDDPPSSDSDSEAGYPEDDDAAFLRRYPRPLDRRIPKYATAADAPWMVTFERRHLAVESSVFKHSPDKNPVASSLIYQAIRQSTTLVAWAVTETGIPVHAERERVADILEILDKSLIGVGGLDPLSEAFDILADEVLRAHMAATRGQQWARAVSRRRSGTLGAAGQAFFDRRVAEDSKQRELIAKDARWSLQQQRKPGAVFESEQLTARQRKRKAWQVARSAKKGGDAPADQRQFGAQRQGGGRGRGGGAAAAGAQ